MRFAKFRIPRAAVLLAFALISGLSAAGLLALHVRERVEQLEAANRMEMTERIVAARNLYPGMVIGADDLALRSFPAQWVGADSLTPGRYTELQGRTVAQAVRAGDALSAGHVLREQTNFSTQLGPGRRAITLPVDQVNSLSGLLQPGDLIDLYVSFEYQRKKLTAPLLQGVLVLATGRETMAGAQLGEGAGYSTLTLDADPQDVIKLVAARQGGTLTAILRHPGDGSADRRAARGDLAALLGLSNRPPPATRKAQILYGASGARALPAWARGVAAANPAAGNGWFEMPLAQVLSSAWQQFNAQAAVGEGAEVLDGAPSWPPDPADDLPEDES